MQRSERQQNHDRGQDDSHPLHMTVRIGEIPSERDPQTAQQHPEAAENRVPEDTAARRHSGEAEQNNQKEPMHRGRMIQIKSIPEKEARYYTLGDWFYDANGNLQIQLPGGGDLIADKHTFLMALHDLVEAALCYHAGITQEEVDAFDMAYQSGGEPGDHALAPYRDQHRRAMLIEHLVADWLGMPGYGRVE